MFSSHQGSSRAKATYMDYLLGSTWNLIARAGGLAVMPWNLLATCWNHIASSWNQIALCWNQNACWFEMADKS